MIKLLDCYSRSMRTMKWFLMTKLIFRMTMTEVILLLRGKV